MRKQNLPVSKQTFFRLNQDSSDSTIEPSEYRAARNIIPAERGVSNNGSKQNIPGTVTRSNGSLPAGTNTTIGSFEDRKNNRLIYFIHNSNNNHGIWYFTPVGSTHTLILQSEYLAFSTSYLITGIDLLNDVLYFTDGLNGLRAFNIPQAVAGFYDTASDALNAQISLYKVPPMTPPTAVRGNDASIVSNNVNSDGWQFCSRFVYNDEELSLFSPLSLLVLPDQFPKKDATNNKITVTQTVHADIQNIIKRVQFAYVKNNSGELFMFKEIDADGSGSYVVDFTNSEATTAIPDQETTSVNIIPRLSRNLAVFKDRVFSTMDLFDYADKGSFTLSLSLYNDVAGTAVFHLPGCSYTYGVIFFDRFGRTNGVLSPTTISIPNAYATSNSNADPPVLRNVQWDLAGTPPAWATAYSIVRKQNNTIQTFFQTPAQVMFYKRDDTERNGVTEVLDQGKIFFETKQNGWSDVVYLRLPSNIPLNIDDTFKVRLLQDIGQDRDTESVMSVVGNKIICGNFGKTGWSSTTAIFLIQLESYRTEPEELFFETGNMYEISGGAFAVSSGVVRGDSHRIEMTNTPGECFQIDSIQVGNGSGGDETQIDVYGAGADRFTRGKFWAATVFSQSPTTASNTIETQEITKERPNVNRAKQNRRSLIATIAGGVIAPVVGNVAGFFLAKKRNKEESAEVEKITSEIRRVYTFDYSKIATDAGRPFVEVRNIRENEEETTIAYSEKFIQNSRVNGTGTFTDLNIYPVSVRRTPTRKLQPAGNTLLAIHERETTSLYAGEAFVKTSDGNEILTKTDSVIGDDRQLRGGYGTKHPESVIEHNSRVWWFDVHNSELLRYDNGLTPLATVYKMKTFFKAKSDSLLQTPGKVVSGYDPYLNILYVTFIIGAEKQTISFVDRPGYEGFIADQYDFTPEMYGKCDEKLYSFINGVLHEHMASATYNNFYGEQFESSITPVFNTEYSQEKIPMAISIESNKAWSVSSITNPGGQSSKIRAAWFDKKGNNYYATVLRNENTNPALLSGQQTGLRSGQKLSGKIFDITIENDSTEQTTIDFMNVGYTRSNGHRVV
jgi:hypothetical protein